MLRPKKTIPGLVVAALALTGCGEGEGAHVDRRGETVGGGAAGNGGAGGHGGAPSLALDVSGEGGAGGAAGFGLGGTGGVGGTGGAGGAGGDGGPVSHAARGVEAYCMKLDECYPGLPYYDGCVVAWQNVELMAYSLSSECDAVIGAYLSCLADLSCEQIQNGEQYTCLDTVDEALLESCSTGIEHP